MYKTQPRTVITIMALVIAACAFFAGPAAADPDPVAYVTITYDLQSYNIYPVYANDFNAAGWAHITDDGNDIWVTISGGDVGDIPAKEEGEEYCECSDGPCHTRTLCTSDDMTCSVYSPGVCSCSSSC